MQLAIDTSTDVATVALTEAGQVVAETSWRSNQNHTREALPNIAHLLKLAELPIAAIDAIVVAKGPGSFNGLRVGASLAKGLAYALKVPLVGISTLEAEAFQHARTGRPTCPLFNAGRGEYAAAIYQAVRGRWGMKLEEHLTTIEELWPRIWKKTIFCGQITPELGTWLTELLGRRAVIVVGGGAIRRAGYLAELGWRRLERRDYDDIASFQPTYMRRPAVTVNRQRREV
jgi:tRNA threonylcarbamoyladenosine biosynthesis protein TsaB